LPTRSRPENHIVRIFVSAYEKGSWKDAMLTFPDEEQDGGVDGLAVRADGARLAMEHTIVEAFAGDISDQSAMLPLLATIEADRSLAVWGLWIQVFVPVGTLHMQKPAVRQSVAKAVHGWLRSNRLTLPKGDSQHACLVAGTAGKADFEITLTLKIVGLDAGNKQSSSYDAKRRNRMGLKPDETKMVERDGRKQRSRKRQSRVESRSQLLRQRKTREGQTDTQQPARPSPPRDLAASHLRHGKRSTDD
jgi:hypothetical protein